MGPVLGIRDLTVCFPGHASDVVAVDGVSLSVGEGEILGIVGESGSGKSMTLSSCVRLVPRPGQITGGSIAFKGRDLLGVTEGDMRRLRGREIAMILQDPLTSLHPSLTVGRQVANAIRDHQSLSRGELRDRALEALAMADIPHPQERLDTYPHQLSGGLRQRVMIALAIVNRPTLLLADEPTTALDVTVQAQILSLLKRLNEESGLSILLVTHNFGLVAGLCERTVVMRGGRVVEEADTSALIRTPRHPYTRALLAAVPRIDVVADVPGAAGRPTASMTEDTESPPEPLIRCEGVTKEFGVGYSKGRRITIRAVDDVSLTIYRGETIGLVGESGSGKTTLARALLRLSDVSAGSLYYDGQDITMVAGAQLRSLRRKIQMVFQDPYSSLNPRMTVQETIAEPIRFHRLCNDEHLGSRVQQLLGMVGLPQRLATRYPFQLSGGERQRVGIARALAAEPEVIVADEPVSSLDVTIQAQIIELFAQLQRDLNLTFLVVAHDLGLVRRMCDRVAVMYLGRLAEVGHTEALFSNPRHPYTLTLLRAAPRLEPAINAKEYARLVVGERPSAVSPPSGCRFHPRCWNATPLCADQTPPLTARDDDVNATFACFHPVVKREGQPASAVERA